MNKLVWSDRYATHIRSIDRDHQSLFELVAALETGIANGNAHTEILHSIDALILYVNEHFEREEMFMHRAGFPGYFGHKKEHRLFRRTIKALKEVYSETPDQLNADRFLEFLKKWLINHIMTSDQDYIPYLTGAKAGDDKIGHSDPDSDISITLTITCTKDKVDIVNEFVELLRDGGKQADALEQAVHTVSEAHNKAAVDKVKKLFS